MKNITLMPPRDHEAVRFAAWLNDPEVVRYSEQRHKHHSRETQIDYWRSAATILPNFVWGIYIESPVRAIGSISATVDRWNQVAQVGIMIGDKSVWGKGYGYEAWKCTCDHLFSSGVRKIEAGCMSINQPMISIMRKYGMTPEGCRQGHFIIKDGFFADELVFGRFKSL